MAKSERPYNLTLTVKLLVNGDSRELAVDHLEHCLIVENVMDLMQQIAADSHVEWSVR